MPFLLTYVYFWLNILPRKLNNLQSIFEFRAHVCFYTMLQYIVLHNFFGIPLCFRLYIDTPNRSY